VQFMTEAIATQQLFQQAEKAVLSPKTLRGEVRVTGLANSKELHGTIVLNSENCLRLEHSILANGKTEQTAVLICNRSVRGGTLCQIGQEPVPLSSRAPSALTTQLCRQGLFRGGWLDALTRANGADDRADTREILMGFFEPPEIRHLRMTRTMEVIRFDYELGTTSTLGGAGGLVQLWVDPKTMLPIRRVIRSKNRSGEDLTVTEVYSSWQVDQAVPATVFELKK
jgi:hypothetical protein